MTPERWERIKDIFQSALEKTADQRAAFLDEACKGSLSLREEIESLIANFEKAGDFLESPAAEAEDDSLIGAILDEQYRIDAIIGRGGMGTVYLARHIALNDAVAIKAIRSDLCRDAEYVRRLRREAQAARSFRHPNAVTVYDYRETKDGLNYIVMEYIEGCSQAFGRAIARAMAKNRIQRQKTCKELIGDLRAALLQPSEVSSAPAQNMTVEKSKALRLLAGPSLLLIFALLVFAVVRLEKGGSPPSAVSAADAEKPAASVVAGEASQKSDEEVKPSWTAARDAFEGEEIPVGFWKGSGRARETILSDNFSKAVWSADFDLWFTLDEKGNAVGEIDLAYSAEMLMDYVTGKGAKPILLKPQPLGDYPPRRRFPIAGVLKGGELTIDIAVEEEKRRPIELTLRADPSATGGKLVLKKIERAAFSPFAGAARLEKNADGSHGAVYKSESEKSAVEWSAKRRFELKKN